MSLIAHPEVLRRRRIWDDKEFIEPQHGRKTPEEAQAERERVIKQEIARREREHQLHMRQFESERVYSTNETHIVFTLSIILVFFMMIIYPWQSTPTLWKVEHSTNQKNATTTWSNLSQSIRKTKIPPWPRPAPVPYPRRLEVKSLFFKKPPKTVPRPAQAIPIAEFKKNSNLAAVKVGEEEMHSQDKQLRPTQSTTQVLVTDVKPPLPKQTQASQDWASTLGKRVSKRLEKGRKTL